MNPTVKKGILRAIVLSGIGLLLLGIFSSQFTSSMVNVVGEKAEAKVSPVRNPEHLPPPKRGEDDAIQPIPLDPDAALESLESPDPVNPQEAEDEHLIPGMKGVSDVNLKFSQDQNDYVAAKPDAEAIKAQLLPGMIPPNIHYMWCGEKQWFEFKHYLSVLSVLKTLTPDKVVIHYEFLPWRDDNLYNLWMGDLKKDYPFLILEPMDDKQKAYCRGDLNVKTGIVMGLLNQDGGLFLSINTWILDITPRERQINIETALTDDNGMLEGFLMMQAGIASNGETLETYFTGNTTSRARKSSCGSAHHMLHESAIPLRCLVVKGGHFDRFWPMDIWELDNAFGRLTRLIFYGTEKVLKPEPTFDTLVPNIGHMVWIGGGPMDFVFYLSVLSLLYVAKVDTVFIHGDLPIPGEYWQKLQTDERTRDRVKFITRTAPSMIYQGPIEPYYRALMSDIIRVDLMIKYGGIYTDTDAIWVKPLTQQDRGYDAVASFDWVDWSWPYPDSVNFGISYGKKNAPFWQIFRESMRELHNDLHGFTGVMLPYRLLEKYPHLLRIDRHLQAICYYSRCHPIWVKDYHNQTVDHVSTGSLDNWKEDLTTFHWTYPNPPELSNMTALLSSTGIFADLGKFVLEKAGLL